MHLKKLSPIPKQSWQPKVNKPPSRRARGDLPPVEGKTVRNSKNPITATKNKTASRESCTTEEHEETSQTSHQWRVKSSITQKKSIIATKSKQPQGIPAQQKSTSLFEHHKGNKVHFRYISTFIYTTKICWDQLWSKCCTMAILFTLHHILVLIDSFGLTNNNLPLTFNVKQFQWCTPTTPPGSGDLTTSIYPCSGSSLYQNPHTIWINHQIQQMNHWNKKFHFLKQLILLNFVTVLHRNICNHIQYSN